MTAFELLILDELVAYGILATKGAVQEISFEPPKPYEEYECSVRVANGGINCDIASCGILNELCLFSKYCIIGNYINVNFNTKNLIETTVRHINSKGSNFGFFMLFENFKVAIEHTSMTPVYPINIATFRSSVVGNALKATYEYFGAFVRTHFFVEDMARNLSLLQQGILALGIDGNISEMCFLLNEKPDNFLGKAFALSYFIIKRQEVLIKEKLDPMFLPSCLKIPENIEKTYEKMIEMNGALKTSKNKEICDICVEGHKETLSTTAITIDSYDYETAIAEAVKVDDFKDTSFGQALLSNNVKLPYSIRNLAYFSYLQGINNKVISVLSRRQKSTLDETLDSMKNSDNIEIVYFGDVLISDIDESNALDVIKNGVFHSVDQYIEVMSNMYKQPPEIIIAALKLKMLRVKTGQTCHIDDSAADHYCECIDMLLATQKILSDETITDNITAKEYTDGVLLPLIILLIKFEEIPYKCLMESSFHLVVKWISDIINSISNLETIGIKVNENGDLNCAIKTVFQNAFGILGIDINTVIDKIS